MKIHLTRLVVFILTLFLTEAAFSQKKDDGDDVYGTSKPNVDNNKYSYSFIDDTEFSIDNFVKGYIILPSNSIKYGILKFNSNVVIFKDSLTQKNKRYDASELKGFVAQADTINKNPLRHIDTHKVLLIFSYATRRKDPIEKGMHGMQIRVDTFKIYADSFMVKASGGHVSPGDHLVHKTKFIKQEIYGEKVCLYKITEPYSTGGYMSTTGTGGLGGVMGGGESYSQNNFYLKRKNEAQYTLVPDRKNLFKKFAKEYLKDNPQLVQDIEQEKLAYNNLDDIVLRYNNER